MKPPVFLISGFVALMMLSVAALQMQSRAQDSTSSTSSSTSQTEDDDDRGDLNLDPIPDPSGPDDTDPPPVNSGTDVVSVDFSKSPEGQIVFGVMLANGDQGTLEFCGVDTVLDVLNSSPAVQAEVVAALRACEEAVPCEDRAARLREQNAALRQQINDLKRQRLLDQVDR